MSKFLCAALLSAGVAPVFAADVGVSISVGEPGFYGQINIGNVAQPQLIYPQPVVIRRAPEFVSAPPIYLHVPPGHEKHWSRHCAEYDACGRPVYFVRDDWYNSEYVARYRNDRGERGDARGHGHGRDHDEGHGRGGKHEDRD